MNNSFNFNFKGTGYLCDLIYQDNMYIAKINVIHRFNSGAMHSDDIWLNCVIEDIRLLPKIAAFKRNLDLQKTIILEFDMQYIGFEYCHLGVIEDDPNTMVFLKGRLVGIGKFFIDGSSPVKNVSNL